MKPEALKGMAVVSVAEGTKLGVIDEVLFDMAQMCIGALRIAANGQKALVPFGQVQSLGSDAVTVANAQVVQWSSAPTPSELSTLPTLSDLRKRKVVDEAGTLLGAVQELEIESPQGHITHLHVHKGGVLGIGGETATVPAADIISVGPDLMVVRVSPPPAG